MSNEGSESPGTSRPAGTASQADQGPAPSPATSGSAPVASGGTARRFEWSHVFRVVAAVWVLSIVVYYGYAAVSLLVFVIQYGPNALTGSTITHALLFDQLVALASQHALVGVLIFIAVVGLTSLGEVTLAGFTRQRATQPTPASPASGIEPGPPGPYPDPRLTQIYDWLKQDPHFLLQLVPFLGAQLLPTFKRALGDELRAFDAQHRWQFMLNIGLEVASLFMSAIPLIAVGAGIGQAVH